MPQGASSARSDSPSASTANFEVLYGDMNGVAIRPPIEAMKTIVPGALRISGRNAWVTAIWPTRFTSSTLRKTSRSMVSIGPPSPTPALFTSPTMPSLPTARCTFCLAAAIERCLVTSIVIGVSLSEPSSASDLASASLRTPANTR